MSDDSTVSDPGIPATIGDAELAMSEFGVVTEARTLRIRRVLPGPIERVWAYLTESEKRGRWLAAGPMELRVGGRVELTFRNSGLSAHAEPAPDKYKEYEGAGFQGRVTRCDPPRVLSYTWGDHSEVTFELTPEGENVLLVLTHRRLPDRTAMVLRRQRLAHPSRNSARSPERPRAARVLVDPCAPGGGIREAAPRPDSPSGQARRGKCARRREPPQAAQVRRCRCRRRAASARADSQN